MKTRKRGGLFKMKNLKTLSDNKRNCLRLTNNHAKIEDALHNKYRCESREFKNKCSKINPRNELQHLHKYCDNPDVLRHYDFSRDGDKVSKRKKPFFLDEVKQNYYELNKNNETFYPFYPWDHYPLYFKPDKDKYRLVGYDEADEEVSEIAEAKSIYLR
jgi:hypothetical protein